MPFPMKPKYKKPDGTFRYYSAAGLYQANSMLGLIYEILKHRFLHLIKDGEWRD